MDNVVAESRRYPNFRDEQKITKLENVGIKYPEFSGTIRYETAFEVGNLERATLNIEEAYEGVEVWVNSNYAGMKVAPPYRFDISNHLVNGSNDLRIEVTNTLERKVRVMNIDAGMYSVFMGGSVLGPSGLIGEVSVYCK